MTKTHNMLTPIAQSNRYSIEKDFWLPVDFKHRVYHIKFHTDELKAPYMDAVYKFVRRFKGECFDTTDLLKDLNSNEFETLFKTLGYGKEIYQRQLNFYHTNEESDDSWKTV